MSQTEPTPQIARAPHGASDGRGPAHGAAGAAGETFRIVADFDETMPFDVQRPATAQAAPLVFNSPHSGRAYPAAFLAASRLANPAIRRSEDGYVDLLFAGVVEIGLPLMRAHFPRAFLDVNREPYELDPRMFSGRLPSYANTRSARVAGGLGTIARIVSDAQEIYAGPLTVDEGLARIETLYHPYHGCLAGLLAETRAAFGHAVLIDCHSMPSGVRGTDGRTRPDVVLGDRHGSSCSARLTAAAADVLSGLGFRVQLNRPYAGGFITEHYGRPARGLHALQIEVNRSLYMDEKTLERHAGMDKLIADLGLLTGRLTALPVEVLSPLSGRFAAE